MEMSLVGCQQPRLIVVPPTPDFETFDADDAVDFAAQFKLILDPWQSDLVHLWLRRDRATDRWVSGTWGISVARQNGKNGSLEAVELYMMVVLGLNVLHTAHQVKTAQKHFRRMKHFFGEKRDDPFAKYPELNRLVKEVRSVNGQEAIYLWNPDTRKDLGALEISARSKGSARGFTNDVLVIDEAQHLKDEHLEALRPAISAAPSGDPVAIYMGTPPKPEAMQEEGEGAAFLRVRRRALDGESSRSAWMEFGLDVDLDLMTEEEIAALAEDRQNWVLTNPALGRRINEQVLLDELNEMGPRSFARERLNVWPSKAASSSASFDLDEWRGSTIYLPPDDVQLAAVGLDMDPTGRLWVSVAARDEGPVKHVELLPDDIYSDGIADAVEWLWKRCRRSNPVVFPQDSGATVLEAALKAKKMRVYRLNNVELGQASDGFEKAVRAGELTHLDDPVLEKTIAEAGTLVMSNGLKRFGRRGDYGGAPLYSAACGWYGAVKWAGRFRTGKASFG